MERKEGLDCLDNAFAWGFSETECSNCGVDNSELSGLLMQCFRCKLVYYCSSKCSTEHLPEHSRFCKSGVLASNPLPHRVNKKELADDSSSADSSRGTFEFSHAGEVEDDDLEYSSTTQLTKMRVEEQKKDECRNAIGLVVTSRRDEEQQEDVSSSSADSGDTYEFSEDPDLEEDEPEPSDIRYLPKGKCEQPTKKDKSLDLKELKAKNADSTRREEEQDDTSSSADSGETYVFSETVELEEDDHDHSDTYQPTKEKAGQPNKQLWSRNLKELKTNATRREEVQQDESSSVDSGDTYEFEEDSNTRSTSVWDSYELLEIISDDDSDNISGKSDVEDLEDQSQICGGCDGSRSFCFLSSDQRSEASHHSGQRRLIEERQCKLCNEFPCRGSEKSRVFELVYTNQGGKQFRHCGPYDALNKIQQKEAEKMEINLRKSETEKREAHVSKHVPTWIGIVLRPTKRRLQADSSSHEQSPSGLKSIEREKPSWIKNSPLRGSIRHRCGRENRNDTVPTALHHDKVTIPNYKAKEIKWEKPDWTKNSPLRHPIDRTPEKVTPTTFTAPWQQGNYTLRSTERGSKLKRQGSIRSNMNENTVGLHNGLI